MAPKLGDPPVAVLRRMECRSVACPARPRLYALGFFTGR